METRSVQVLPTCSYIWFRITDGALDISALQKWKRKQKKDFKSLRESSRNSRGETNQMEIKGKPKKDYQRKNIARLPEKPKDY